jgi:uncharacterized protein (TIGR02246 family)
MKQFHRIVLRGCIAVILAMFAVMARPSDGWSKSTRCAAATPSQIANLFVRWNAALRTLDPDKVVQTYAPDAILLPTVENGPLIGRDAIRGYFVHFLEKHPEGAINTRTIRIGCNIAFDTGLYTFTLDGDQGGTRVPIRARYTYIYQMSGGHWLIAHHHSSAQPK